MSTHIRSVIAFLLITVTFIFAGPTSAQFPPAPGTGPGLAETIEAIDAARVTTRILYITAHPDDESAAVLTYLARGLHADVALLSLTRGEGGQNALGPEQAPQLGLIRTQELLAATRGYGVKLYFTRAKDFGFSKTPEETQKIWGDQVLEDMVRIIRTFRPNIVINNWGGVHTGHGHHQAAGILTPKAVEAAKEISFCKDCGTVWNVDQILDIDRGSDHPSGYILPLDAVSPLWGKTWREIGIDAFANHRTQGVSVFLGSPFIRRPVALKREDGGQFDPATLHKGLAEIRELHGCVNNSKECGPLKLADAKIAEARTLAFDLDWSKATQSLMDARTSILKAITWTDVLDVPEHALDDEKKAVLLNVINALKLAAGFKLTAESEHANVVLNEPFKFTLRSNCRPDIDCAVTGPVMSLRGPAKLGPIKGDIAKGISFELTLSTNDLRNPQVDAPIKADNSAAIICLQGFPGACTPIVSVDASSVHVHRVPLRVVPAYTLAVEPKQTVEILANQHEPFDVFLRIHSNSTKNAEVSVGMAVPKGWTVTAPLPIKFQGEGDQYARLTVTPPIKIASGDYVLTAYAQRGDEKFTTSLAPLPTMPTLLWSEPAECKVHAFDINVPANLRVGYISAEDEPVPAALRNLGINVEMLDANKLNFGDLSKFNAIVVGIRAYEIRTDLPGANQRLLDYVQNGGTLLVQYQRDFAWDKTNFAPYRATIENDAAHSLSRITDETADVKFLKTDDPLLNTPNKITQDDFKGWIQERGLYFWTTFDDKYTPLLSMHDPNEKDLTGGLVYTHLGKGTYIYTGLAFFRQLPEGVPGAYRLFVNLLSASHPN